MKEESIHLNSEQMKLQKIHCHLYSECMTIRESTVAADNRSHFLETMFPVSLKALSLLELDAGMLRTPRATLLSFGNLVLRVVELQNFNRSNPSLTKQLFVKSSSNTAFTLFSTSELLSLCSVSSCHSKKLVVYIADNANFTWWSIGMIILTNFVSTDIGRRNKGWYVVRSKIFYHDFFIFLKRI